MDSNSKLAKLRKGAGVDSICSTRTNVRVQLVAVQVRPVAVNNQKLVNDRQLGR